MIACEGFRAGDSEVYTMNADGTGVRRLTRHPAFVEHHRRPAPRASEEAR